MTYGQVLNVRISLLVPDPNKEIFIQESIVLNTIAGHKFSFVFLQLPLIFSDLFLFLFQPGKLLPSAHAVEREYKLVYSRDLLFIFTSGHLLMWSCQLLDHETFDITIGKHNFLIKPCLNKHTQQREKQKQIPVVSN